MRSTRWRFAEVSTVAAMLLSFVLLVVPGYGYLMSVFFTVIFSPVYFLFSCALWGVLIDRNSSWRPWLVVASVIAGGGVFVVMDILVNRIGVGLHPPVLLSLVALSVSAVCFGLLYPLFRTRGE